MKYNLGKLLLTLLLLTVARGKFRITVSQGPPSISLGKATVHKTAGSMEVQWRKHFYRSMNIKHRFLVMLFMQLAKKSIKR